MIYWLGRLLSIIWYRLCFHFRVSGADNIPAQGGAIIAANHASFLDPMAVGSGTSRKVTFIARGSLTKKALYRLLTAGLNIIAIDRDRGDRVALRLVTDALMEGKLCAIFPEGTRSKDGKLGRMKAGVVLLARQANVPIVPAYVSGSYRIWPRQRRWPRLTGRLGVAYGKPIRLDGCDRQEAMNRLLGAIQELEARESRVEKTDNDSPGDGESDSNEPAAQGCSSAAGSTSAVDAIPK